jgi:hypothetical protein
MGFIINPYQVQPSGPSYGTLTTAWITATGETDTTILGALNTLESDLTTYGLTSKIKALYPFVGGTAAKHKYNFMDARDLDAAFRLSFNGGLTHSSTGVKGGGINNYIDTFVNPNNNLTLDSCHVATYLRTNVLETTIEIGISESSFGTEIILIPRYSSDVNLFNIQKSGSRISTSSTDSRGLFLLNRTSSTLQNAWRNSTKLATDTNTSALRPNGNIWLTAWNNEPAPSITYPSTRETAFVSIGDGLTDTNASNLYTAVQAFQTTLGRNV